MRRKPTWDVLTGDALTRLREMPDETVQCCITSPPYYGLRDYGVDGQIGLERTPDEFVATLVAVFSEVRRVLRMDGTLWLNMGDSYNNRAVSRPSSHQAGLGFTSDHLATSWREHAANDRAHLSIRDSNLKEKDLFGVPWLLAFALRADGWYLRSDIIWHKPNPMPESVRDRPTCAHEHIFLLARSARYLYNGAAIREPWADDRQGGDGSGKKRERNVGGRTDGFTTPNGVYPRANGGRNKRNVWTVAPRPFRGAHFATFPPALIEPMILAGSAPDDLVLDPFAGAGTVGLVCVQHGRRFTGIELNPAYADMARQRIAASIPDDDPQLSLEIV